MKETLLATAGPRPVKDLPSYIYIMATFGAAGDVSPVKIGIASNPERRLASIQTSCPNPIRMHTFLGPMHRDYARYIESETHKLFGKHRLHGEWFDLPPERAVETVVGMIHAICTPDMVDEILGAQNP